MAVSVWRWHREIADRTNSGIDLGTHWLRMNDGKPWLDGKFKDTEDPIQLVCVCAMCLTGFDALSR